MKRCLLLIVDQLAGHWAEGVTTSAGYPPPNVKDYHERGLIPNISSCIKGGLWVERPLNQGECHTAHGIRYLAAGEYTTRVDHDEFIKGGQQETMIQAFERTQDTDWIGRKVACFGSACWVKPGWLHTRGHEVGLTGFYPDRATINDYVVPWMSSNEDWELIVLYLAEHDLTATSSGTPVYLEKPSHYVCDKHHHLVENVDTDVGRVVSFLQEKKFWDETILVIASDHAYHLGCDIASPALNPPIGPRMGTDRCWDHVASSDAQGAAAYNCNVWDFENNRPSASVSDCCRRTTFIITGGGLEPSWRDRSIAEAEIIDVPATIAHLMGFEFPCQGNSII